MRFFWLSVILLALFLVASTAAVTLSVYKSAKTTKKSMLPYATRFSRVTFRIQHFIDENDEQQEMGWYLGERILTIENASDETIKIKVPPVRTLDITPNSLNYLGGWTPEEFKQSGVIEIPAKGEATFKGTFEYVMLKKPSLNELYDNHDFRDGWVFDVPDDEPSAQWLSGTILSEPIEWLPAEKK